jgi:transcriptional regulator with XRE-family HTH domain
MGSGARPNYPAIIGTQAKKIRTRAGMTQLDVAEQSGIFPTYLSQIELGQANPTINLLAALAATLDVDVRELLAEDLPD